MERSFAETTLSSPQSPNPIWRPRRRVNKNQTPQRLDGGVGIYQNSPVNSVTHGITFQQNVIGPLLINVCKLFTEWLNVSPCTETACFISQAAIEWCPKILLKNKDDVSSMQIYDAIVPAFLRMIGQLLMIPGNCDVLKEVLNALSDDGRSIDEMQKVLSSILVPKSNQLIIIELVNCFLNVTYDSLPDESHFLRLELPDTFDDDWTLPKRSLSGLLLAIVSHQPSCNILANNLIERFGDHIQESTYNKLAAFFDIQCLWILISDAAICKISANIIEAIISTVEQIVLADFHDDRLKLLIEDFRSRVK